MRCRKLVAGVAVAALLSLSPSALAQDNLKLAVGARGVGETFVPELGQNAGIFKKHGLALDIFYTQGGGETIQVVISNAAHIGVAIGFLGTIGAYAKGAPVRIMAAEATGAADYWYAKNPAIKTIKDADGHSIAFSTNGSSTQSIVRAFINEFKLTAAKPTATGNPATTLTTVMTDQVDIGWASPPFGLKEIEEGKIHIVAKATDAAMVRGQTIRVNVVNAETLKNRKAVVERFMQAYRETVDYMYSDNPQVIKDYAEFVKVPEAMAKRVRDEFFPKSLINPDEIKGLEPLMAEAVTLKFVPAPLTKEQLAELIQIPPRKK